MRMNDFYILYDLEAERYDLEPCVMPMRWLTSAKTYCEISETHTDR